MGPDQLNGSTGAGQQNIAEPPPTTEPTVTSQDPSHGTSEQTNNQVLNGRPVDQQEIQDLKRKLGHQAGENGFLREKLAKVEGMLEALTRGSQQQTQEQAPDYEQTFFESPNKAFGKLSEDILNKVTRLIDERTNQVTSQAKQAEAAKQIWNNFYKDNPDLAVISDYIERVVVKDLQSQINHLPINDALEVVKAEGKRKLIELGRKGLFNSNGGQTNYSEPANKVSSKAASESAPAQPMTFKDLHNEQLSAVKSLGSRLTSKIV